MIVEEEEIILEKDQVCVIPPATPHYGESLGEDALFYEVFAPVRFQNLIGFLGKIF
jgi:mannose-6-phosphate isomerase-like protein (cupin superfamily)